MIWIIPAVVAALSFFKLGSLYVWVKVMSAVIKVLVVFCSLLLSSGAAVWVLLRRRPR